MWDRIRGTNGRVNWVRLGGASRDNCAKHPKSGDQILATLKIASIVKNNFEGLNDAIV